MAEDILTRNDYQLRERLFHIPCKNQFITIYYESSSTSLSTNDGGNKVARSIFVFLVFRSFSCLTLGSFQFGNGLFSRNSDPSEYFKSCTSCAICRGESSSSCSSSCTSSKALSDQIFHRSCIIITIIVIVNIIIFAMRVGIWRRPLNKLYNIIIAFIMRIIPTCKDLFILRRLYQPLSFLRFFRFILIIKMINLVQ